MIDTSKKYLWDALDVDITTLNLRELDYKKANNRIVFDVITQIIKRDPDVVSIICGKYAGKNKIFINYITGSTLVLEFFVPAFSGYDSKPYSNVRAFLAQISYYRSYQGAYGYTSQIFTIK